MTPEQAQNLIDTVDRRIPRAWRGDLKIEDTGELDTANGYPQGTPFVEISARSKLARMQALISIGPYAANPPDEWFDGWERVRDGAGRLRWVFRVYKPTASQQQPDVFPAES